MHDEAIQKELTFRGLLGLPRHSFLIPRNDTT